MKRNKTSLCVSHERFCQNYQDRIARGESAKAAATKAYRTAIYRGALGDEAIEGNARRLLSKPAVRTRIAELGQQAAMAAGLTVQWVLLQARQIAVSNPLTTNRLAALKLICEVSGFYAPQKVKAEVQQQTTVTMEMLVAESYKSHPRQIEHREQPRLVENVTRQALHK